MPTITTSDGVRLNYTDEGAGTPIVLIAGFCAPLESWELQRRPLLEAGYRVIGFDRRSHGASESPSYGQRLSRHGADVHEFLRALDLEDVVLIGGSMGASTIWAYYDLFGPGWLRAVVTIDQTPKMVNDATWSHGFYGLTRENVGTFFDNGVPGTGRGRQDRLAGLSRVTEALGRPPVFADPSTPERRALLQNHAEADWRDVIARMTVPSLFIAGRDSQLWPSTHALDLNESARVVTLDDCGHAANLDQPEAVNDAILEFLK
ncbi:alpha/beta fold hydrolase [Paractinoplanes atraurantiacus]|uniref:Pimeloyl-ACP methyl ester carboxylesterase n=1 Tax=Paractinoplanes atraurantiacus TaxID=1036182 RepID=A0A285GIF5_9ACTN|nr:alpha/beta hydrolase [Actinoplanes atraurantiacus]SNY23380.1 Pimeloyl-ACP methyl ester carboxylesterase [Actinoplanes atraurantiacus]